VRKRGSSVVTVLECPRRTCSRNVRNGDLIFCVCNSEIAAVSRCTTSVLDFSEEAVRCVVRSVC
jgi:hypothetical protein